MTTIYYFLLIFLKDSMIIQQFLFLENKKSFAFKVLCKKRNEMQAQSVATSKSLSRL
jgi:hypothetical protein